MVAVFARSFFTCLLFDFLNDKIKLNMGIFVNPDNSAFQSALNAKSILDEEKLIWNAFLLSIRNIPHEASGRERRRGVLSFDEIV